jgi:hypothetical protein
MTIGLLGVIVTTSAVGSAAEETVRIPDTPVGRQLSWVLASLNAGDVLRTASVSDHFAPTVSQQPAGIVREFEMASQAMAPVTLGGFVGTATENEIVAIVRDRDGATHWLTLETDPYSGHRISEWSIRPAERLKANEIGGVIWNGSRDAPLSGIAMELVDGGTGAAFTPRVRCRTDFTGYCRFAVPGGAGSVAVKVTDMVLWGRMDTYNFFSETALGSERTFFQALPPNSIAFFARRAGLEPESAKGHFFGNLVYVDAETGRYLGQAGCGEIALTPGSARIFYTKEWGAHPDPSQKHTNPLRSAWWAFNLDPGRYTITARIGGRTLEATAAILQPETFSAISIRIPWDRSVPLPRCE